MNAAPTTLPMPRGLSPSAITRRVDPWIVGAAMALLALGVVVVYSASAVRASEASGSSVGYLVKHVTSIALGLIGMSVAMRIPLEKWSRYAYALLALAFVMLVLVFVPGIGRRVNGAMRWINLGFMGFQPGELAKLAVCVYLAHSLAKKREKVVSFSVGFLPHVIVTSALVLLVLVQPDFGTAAILFTILGLTMFIAGTKIGYLLMVGVAAIPVGAIYVLTHPHAARRLTAFLDPEGNRFAAGYQVWESLVAFGSGGVLGSGLGQGHQKLYFLPEAHTDFILAVIGEELGFVGVALVCALFTILVGRALLIAQRAKTRFSTFLSFGIASWFGCQALVNMMVVIALVPTKGLTLPFISFGGSSMIMTLTALGVLLRIDAEEKSAGRAKA